MARTYKRKQTKKYKLPPIKAPNTGFWDNVEEEFFNKKKR